MIKIIEKSIYNKNSYYNYMKIEKYSYNDGFESEKDFRKMLYLQKLKSIKKSIENASKELKEVLSIINIRQFQLISCEKYEENQILNHLEELHSKRRVLSKEVDRLKNIYDRIINK